MNLTDTFRNVDANAPWFFPTLAGVLGACVGSFLNVCIYRMPAGKSVVHPGSQCACGKPIGWRDNLPIASWLILGGRARCCGRRFSFRYPAIEMLTAALFIACVLLFSPAKAIAVMVFVSLSIVGAFIDIDHLELPDAVTIWGMAAGVGCSLFLPALHGRAHEVYLIASFHAGMDALIGAFIGSALVLWILLFAEKILGKEGMGFGDVTLLGCIGAFTGWQGALFSVFGGAVVGLVANLAVLTFSGKNAFAAYQEEPRQQADGSTADTNLGELRVPFGPSLSAASLIYLFVLQPYVDGYLASIAADLRF